MYTIRKKDNYDEHSLSSFGDDKSKLGVAKQVRVAKNFYSRLLGLMFLEKMEDFDGLIIESCNSVHTFFMRFPLDLVFLNKNNEVVKVKRNVFPWRMTFPEFKASKVLEMRASTLPKDIKRGDLLEVICIS